MVCKWCGHWFDLLCSQVGDVMLVHWGGSAGCDSYRRLVEPGVLRVLRVPLVERKKGPLGGVAAWWCREMATKQSSACRWAGGPGVWGSGQEGGTPRAKGEGRASRGGSQARVLAGAWGGGLCWVLAGVPALHAESGACRTDCRKHIKVDTPRELYAQHKKNTRINAGMGKQPCATTGCTRPAEPLRSA
jgi:hypothetical protein